MQMYKAVRKVHGDLMSWMTPEIEHPKTSDPEYMKFCVTYRPGEPTFAPDGGRLFVSDTLQHVITFLTAPNVEIWLCEVEGAREQLTSANNWSNIPEFWQGKLAKWCIAGTPPGTYTADSVTLIERIPKDEIDSLRAAWRMRVDVARYPRSLYVIHHGANV